MTDVAGHQDSSDEVSESDLVAVIGYAGRFPGAPNADAFWGLLRAGREALHHFSDAELLAQGVTRAQIDHPHAVKCGMRLEGVDAFDAEFFGYTTGQAAAIDPQQRLLLELAWEALEHAGAANAPSEMPVGLYVTCSPSTYRRTEIDAADLATFQAVMDTGQDFAASRISYKLGLTGPSFLIQSACSASLVAVHLACQGLLNFECEVALAGGVSIRFPQAGHIHHKGYTLSSDGHSRAYDANATGSTPGRGGGVVVLKRLTEAVRDRDEIHAVIRGTAINNDGARKVGYAAPSAEGQRRVIASAMAVAGVDPKSITLLEGSAASTPLGDAIELSALLEVFGDAKAGSCGLGSVKTNVGHLDAASGVASLIKTILCLKHRERVPSLHFRDPNPALAAGDAPIFVDTAHRPWETSGGPRRAGVSSFGIGGTNAHAILEEAPPQSARAPRRGDLIFLLSARSSAALAQSRIDLAEFVAANDGIDAADVAATLQLGRRLFDHRCHIVVRDGADLVAKIRAGVGPEAVAPPSQLRPVFGFSGGERLGAADLEAAAAGQVVPLTTLNDLLDEIDPALACRLRGAIAGPSAATLGVVEARQLALVLEVTLARAWMALGLDPTRLVARGWGVLSAACFSGTITIAEAIAMAAQDRPEGLPPTSITPDAVAGDKGATVIHRLGEPTLAGLPKFEPREDEIILWFDTDVAAELDRAEQLALSAERGAGLFGPLFVLGELWTRNVPLNWSRFNAGGTAYRMALPTYPFQRRSLDSATSLSDTGAEEATELEAAIARIWREALGRGRLGLDEDFFDVGGDSLAAIRIVADLEALIGVELDLAAFLGQRPTVRTVAARLVDQLANELVGDAAPTPAAGREGAPDGPTDEHFQAERAPQ